MILAIALIKYVTKKTNGEHKRVQTKEITTWSGLYRFSKAEIENAINFGNERKCLGRGSAGQVYKGVLPSGQAVAIKQIYRTNTSDSFKREVDGLSRVRHPNLVCLFGCCMEDGEQYLVYEYCSAGNLAQHLLSIYLSPPLYFTCVHGLICTSQVPPHFMFFESPALILSNFVPKICLCLCPGKDTILTWEKRIKILRDCALALRYLHRHLDGCIVHRDIKVRIYAHALLIV